MTREITPQEIILQKIHVLVPNAKASVRPFIEGSFMGVDPIFRGDFAINWDASDGECPTIEAINAVTDSQVSDMDEVKRKSYRDEMSAQDLRLKGLFRIERRMRPELTFSEYLDQLESEVV